MKKIICLLMCMVLFVAASVSMASAADTAPVLEYELEDTHYTIEFEDDDISPEKQQFIAHKLLGLDDGSVQTRGLGCTLFGHDLATKTVYRITHKHRAAVPRCLRKTYEITYCEDCDDYYEEELLFSFYIDCCPAN